MALTRNQTAWARWLASQGVPRAHIARVLDAPAREVAAGCKRRVHGRTKWHVSTAQASECRRLRREGRSYRAIGQAMGFPWYVAARCLRGAWKPPEPRPPRPRDASRPGVRSVTATRFRRLIELGYVASRAAELLQLDGNQAEDLAERLGPDGRVRPRPRASAGWSDVEADLTAAGDVAELPVPAQIAAEMPPLTMPADPAEWRNFRRGDGG